MVAESKRTYQKPTLERVVLIPKENVLGDCMTTSASGDIGQCDPPVEICEVGKVRGWKP